VKKTESEMLSYKNFGETSLREIKEMLSSRGLRLGMFREDAATRAAHERARKGQNRELLAKPIDELELGVRSRKCMDMLNVSTIGDLVAMSEAELAGVKNFGRVSLNEIKKRLSEMGLSLRDSK
jgi:DNA-directed RNA polymerase subunit alpha